MTDGLKKIQVDEASFKEIIEEDLIYVDKTWFIHKLITSKVKNYFLSRPRRFGKTVLLETIEEVFDGEEELFK
ncbi:MAG: AAA family ATPase [Deltaproteobacteria bacterium]|nr:AAA family ATPase [Deltaproteobacteria bacterium]